VGTAGQENQGLLHARHSHFQMAPTDPPHGTAKPLSQDGDTFGEM